VAKKSRSIAKEDNTLAAYIAQMEVQSFAAFLAFLFNKEACGHAFGVDYLVAHTLHGKGERGGDVVVNLEEFNQGKIEKFNSNWGYVKDKSAAAAAVQAFSHWTWDKTGGELMVVDVQVISWILA
jgi:hypothetical protein